MRLKYIGTVTYFELRPPLSSSTCNRNQSQTREYTLKEGKKHLTFKKDDTWPIRTIIH
jgi:hypothetical protein